ncbi:MAG: protein kinase [Myxococcota bacterium]
MPARVGRYDLKRELGRGGMGSVHLAYDPQLDRDVAVKLLHGRGGSQQRLLREARAVARIRHAHVVAVHDVGEFERADGSVGVFMVMEFIRGQDMAAWLRDAKPSADEILDAFTQAGRGLAAAHRSGVIHRDFKASNVLLDEHGQALVLDFGLARGFESETTNDVPTTSGVRADGVLSMSADLTEAGSVLGTPRYMSPEQHRGLDLDAASDQYSFCLALCTALLGRYPLPTASLESMLRAKLKVDLPLDDLPLSRRMRAALRRGLEPKVERRWPSMDALLRGLSARSFGSTAVGLGGMALAAFGVSAALLLPEGPTQDTAADPCADAPPHMEETWNDAARDRVRSAFEGAKNPSVTAGYFLGEVDRVATALDAAVRRTCEAHAAGDLSAAQAQARSTCFEEHRAQIGALSTRVVSTEGAMAHAADLLALLPATAECDAPPAIAASGSAALRERLFNLRLLVVEEELEGAAAEYDALVAEVRSAGADALLTDVLLVGAMLFHRTGAVEERMAASTEALRLAERLGRDDLAVDAILAQAEALASGKADQLAEARRLLEQARAKAQRTGSSAQNRLARVDYFDAILCEREMFQRAEGATPEACLAKARAAVASAGESMSETRSHALNIAANLAAAAGKMDEAQEMIDASMDSRIASVGPDHPTLVVPLRVRARIHNKRGDAKAATADLDRALEIARAHGGLASKNAGFVLTERGKLKEAAGDFEAASKDYAAALEGLPQPFKLQVQSNLGFMMFLQGRYEDALTEIDDVLTAEAALAQRQPRVRSDMLTMRADALLLLDRVDDALAAIERARAMIEDDEHTRPNQRIQSLLVLASAQRRAGRSRDANKAVTQARSLFDASPGSEPMLEGRIELERGLLDEDRQALTRARAILADDPMSTRLRALIDDALAALPP